MAMDNVPRRASTTPTAQQVVVLQQRINSTLLKIIRTNFDTQYASQASSLVEFRDAVAVHGGTTDDAMLLADFRSRVPLSDYDAYKPFVDKFEATPCKEEDVVNLLSPGLPDIFGSSSATSGTRSKRLPKYHHGGESNFYSRFFGPERKSPLAGVLCTAYRDVKEIERSPGEVVRRIPVCVVTGSMLRRAFGWYIDDGNQLSRSIPGYAVPWAATVIVHLPSFLIIHGLFFLVYRDLELFHIPYSTTFIDLIRYIDERWDVLVSSIRDGTVPTTLKGIEHVRAHLQAHLVADRERAAELLDIGPPSSQEGWFTRVWPNTKEVTTVCSGAFATVLPKMRFILGPTVAIRSPGYYASEISLGLAPNDAETLDEFPLRILDVVEFLDISQAEKHQNLRQAWEVEVGKQYEPVLTTRDGLWRYQLGDVVDIVGFDSKNDVPVFKYFGKRSLTLHFTDRQITDIHLLAAVEGVSSDDVIQVLEFTTMVDDRTLPPSVGFFVELAGPLGPNAQQARQQLFDALVAVNAEHQRARDLGRMGLPTIRIVKPGTFTEYRQWKTEAANVGSGQIKVPPVLLKPSEQDWILEYVVQEL